MFRVGIFLFDVYKDMKGVNMPNKNKKRLIVTFTVLLFVLSSLLICFFYTRNKLELIKVPVSSYNLSKRTLIDETTYEMIEVPKAYLNNEVVIDETYLVNKCVKIDSLVPKGSFFYKGNLEDVDNISDNLKYELKDDEVAYDISANDLNANQGYLKEGMYVDIYLTINKDKVLSDLLINNLKIIGLYDLNHKSILDYDDGAVLQNVCLAVPSESVAYLNKALTIGKLNITIGNNCYEDEESILNEESAIFNYLR